MTATPATTTLVTTIVAFPGMPPMKVTVTQLPTGSYSVAGPYSEPASFHTYAAALRCYANIVDAILAPDAS